MLCPNCKTKMHTVETKSHYGASLFLDQCPACGGLWLDRRELYRVGDGEAANIHTKVDPLDIDKLVELVPVKKELICPRDGVLLEPFSDKFFPESIEVERCPQCGGFWFNHGEFGDFQKWRCGHRKEHKSGGSKLSPELEKKVNRLLLAHSNNDAYDSIVSLGRFLSQPAHQYSFGDTDKTFAGDGTQYKYAKMIETVITMLLRLLLRGF